MKKSEELEKVIAFLDQINSSYNFCNEEMKRCDDLTQDYLHKLELEETSYSERAKIATALKKVRKERRIYKDKIDVLLELLVINDSDFITKFKNQLRQVLGAVRKAEKKQENRIYINKVLKEE